VPGFCPGLFELFCCRVGTWRKYALLCTGQRYLAYLGLALYKMWSRLLRCIVQVAADLVCFFSVKGGYAIWNVSWESASSECYLYAHIKLGKHIKIMQRMYVHANSPSKRERQLFSSLHTCSNQSTPSHPLTTAQKHYSSSSSSHYSYPAQPPSLDPT
jgi:hypothetical protein